MSDTIQDGLPRVTLKPRRALPFFSRHPWVFAGAVEQVDDHATAGSEVAVFSHDGEFIARGLYNPDSNLQVRLYSWDAERALMKASGPSDCMRRSTSGHDSSQKQGNSRRADWSSAKGTGFPA